MILVSVQTLYGDCRIVLSGVYCGHSQLISIHTFPHICKRKPGEAMSAAQPVYIGTDGGATTSKVGGVWGDGTTVSTNLLQRPTNASLGPEAVVYGWVEAIAAYLEQNGLTWDQVQGVGVAIPGPRRSYGVLERGPNLPESFVGFDVYTASSRA